MRVTFGLLSICVALLVAACGGNSVGGNDQTASNFEPPLDGDGLPTIELPARWATADAQRLETLINSADAVFSGTVVALKGVRTTMSQAGGGEQPEPAPRWADLPVSQYEVRLESVLTGNLTLGQAVTLEQLGGVETRPDGTQVRLTLEGDEPLQVGQTYLFFGSLQEDGSITAAPFGRMRVRPNGSLAAEAGWGHLGALQDLSRMSLVGAEQQIKVKARD